MKIICEDSLHRFHTFENPKTTEDNVIFPKDGFSLVTRTPKSKCILYDANIAKQMDEKLNQINGFKRAIDKLEEERRALFKTGVKAFPEGGK